MAKSILKKVSLILVFSFFFEQLSFANPDLKPLSFDFTNKDQKLWAKSVLPSIPDSVATIEDAWVAPHVIARRPQADEAILTAKIASPSARNDKLFILIQDAHTNNSGQLNTAKLLDLLFHNPQSTIHHPHFVFLEAGSGNES
ncbi:MAG: hypothetical protein HYZ52_00545, partial [Candidatus Omnitrophica bacterium]|nr:hypothetical protein [Candidatus Omnitrophota bacterium]